MAELECNIVTPSRKIFEGKAEYVYAPGKVGEFGVLPDHESFVTILDVGIIEVKPLENSGTIRMVVVGGYCEISENKIFVIADEVVLKEDINPEEVRSGLQEYKKKLSSMNVGDSKYKKIERKLKKFEKMLELVS